MPEESINTNTNTDIALVAKTKTKTKEPRTGMTTPLENPLVKNGRKLCLQTLDTVLATAESQELLRVDMEERLRMDPLGFFTDIVMPNLPKQTLIEANVNAKAALAIILTEEIITSDDDETIKHEDKNMIDAVPTLTPIVPIISPEGVESPFARREEVPVPVPAPVPVPVLATTESV